MFIQQEFHNISSRPSCFPFPPSMTYLLFLLTVLDHEWRCERLNCKLGNTLRRGWSRLYGCCKVMASPSFTSSLRRRQTLRTPTSTKQGTTVSSTVVSGVENLDLWPAKERRTKTGGVSRRVTVLGYLPVVRSLNLYIKHQTSKSACLVRYLRTYTSTPPAVYLVEESMSRKCVWEHEKWWKVMVIVSEIRRLLVLWWYETCLLPREWRE